MKRRDFNRMALGIGLSPMLSDRSLAQWYEGPSPPTQPPPQKFNIVIKHSPRAYNQVNVPRKSAAGRRFTIYWTWSYPWEANSRAVQTLGEAASIFLPRSGSATSVAR